jgi:hypothetical protein
MMGVSYPTKLPRDFMLDVGLGRVTGFSRVTASGVNPDVATGSVPEDIWYHGGLYPLPWTAATMEALSDSANDAPAGTGMRTMQVIGLDANYVEQSETVALNGTNVVALTKSYLRINRIQITGAGSLRVNAGTVTIREAGGGQVRGKMRAGYGIARQCVYTVPMGYSLAICEVTQGAFHAVGQPGEATLTKVFQSPNGFFRQTLEASIEATVHENIVAVPILVPEKWDFLIRCNAVTANDTVVSASFSGVQLLNTLL